MKILVLAENYTNLEDVVSLHYIHTRNLYYLQQGHDIDVLSFSTSDDYMLDGINVFRKEYFDEVKLQSYDIVLSHAPNIRNHMRFIKKNRRYISKLLYFFHGHEVLNTSKVYPEPFHYKKKTTVSKIFERIYNNFKLNYWRFYTYKNRESINFVFVSNWMLEKFVEETGVNKSKLPNFEIIENSAGSDFIRNQYNSQVEKEFDIITIRNNLDGSKYCMDIVIKQAQENPDLKFCVIGKGVFFNYYKKPDNLEHISRNLKHDEIISFLNRSRSMYLPTRLDSQGVMACEVASFGMPLITSDLEICKEMLSEFPNVDFVSNMETVSNMASIIQKLWRTLPVDKNLRFSDNNTIIRELDFMKEIINNG